MSDIEKSETVIGKARVLIKKYTANGGNGDVARRKSSINFTIKDLAARKAAKEDEGSVNNKNDSEINLPAGWKEMTDKKSNRKYYVNT